MALYRKVALDIGCFILSSWVSPTREPFDIFVLFFYQSPKGQHTYIVYCRVHCIQVAVMLGPARLQIMRDIGWLLHFQSTSWQSKIAMESRNFWTLTIFARCNIMTDNYSKVFYIVLQRLSRLIILSP